MDQTGTVEWIGTVECTGMEWWNMCVLRSHSKHDAWATTCVIQLCRPTSYTCSVFVTLKANKALLGMSSRLCAVHVSVPVLLSTILVRQQFAHGYVGVCVPLLLVTFDLCLSLSNPDPSPSKPQSVCHMQLRAVSYLKNCTTQFARAPTVYTHSTHVRTIFTTVIIIILY